MLEQLAAHPIVPYMFGITTGLFLALCLIQVEQVFRNWYSQRQQNKLEQIALRQAALRARAREEATEIDDDRMMCAVCWEQRHPGIAWPWQRRTLCIDHLMVERGSSQAADQKQEYAMHH